MNGWLLVATHGLAILATWLWCKHPDDVKAWVLTQVDRLRKPKA